MFTGAASSVGNALQQAPGGLANLGARIPSFRAPDNYYKGYARQGQNPASFLTGLTGQAMQNPSLQGTMPGFENESSPDKPAKQKSFLDNIFPGGSTQGIAGMAIPAIGNMFAPKSPKIPDLNALSGVQAFQNFRPGNSMSPEYKTMLNNNTDRLRDKRVQDLQATYRSARPGTDYLTDTNYQRDLAEIERQVQSQSADDLAKAEGTFSAQEQERLSTLANMEIFEIMQQTGLDAKEADDFKQMFSNYGNMFLTNATKKSNPMDEYWQEMEDMMRAKQNASARGSNGV